MLRLHINGVLRTEIPASSWAHPLSDNLHQASVNGQDAGYVLCSVQEDLYSPSKGMYDQMRICDVDRVELFEFPNPAINFTVVDALTTHVFGAVPSKDGVRFASLDHVRRQAGTTPFDTTVVASLQSLPSPSHCPALPQAGSHVFMLYNGSFYKFDPRLVLVDNTLDKPADSGTSNRTHGQCSSVTKNFVNEGTCVRRPSCASPTFSSVQIPLNYTTLRLW
jgi:hypothetical protein